MAHVCRDLDKLIEDVDKQATGKKPKLTQAEADSITDQAERLHGCEEPAPAYDHAVHLHVSGNRRA